MMESVVNSGRDPSDCLVLHCLPLMREQPMARKELKLNLMLPLAVFCRAVCRQFKFFWLSQLVQN